MSRTRPRLLAAAALIAIAATLSPTPADARKVLAPLDPEVAVTRFGLDAYAMLRTRPGNVAFSPASIFLAMSLLHAGAGGDTADDLARVMHLQRWDAAALDKAFASWLTQLRPSRRKGTRLDLANGIWVSKGSKLAPSYRKRIERKYRAAVTVADFAGEPDEQRVSINAWIAKHTGKKIKELLPTGSVTEDTEVVLANAVYFLGKWAEKFDRKDTRDGAFRLADGTTVTVPLMHRSGAARYADTGDAIVVELPYRGSSLAMLAVLPGDGKDLASIESTLSPALLNGWVAALADEREVEIALPRFEVDQRTDLEQLLTDLGLGSLFQSVDTSRMFSKARDLAVTGAFHQTVVDVTEEGTEAAAATAIEVGVTSVRLTPRFIADQPFLWMIRDTRTGAVLFMGRTSDPR